MSLLMDALKKTEQAKQRQGGLPSDTLELQLESQDPAPAQAQISLQEALPPLKEPQGSPVVDADQSHEPVPVLPSEPRMEEQGLDDPAGHPETWIDLDSPGGQENGQKPAEKSTDKIRANQTPEKADLAARHQARAVFTAKKSSGDQARLTMLAATAAVLVLGLGGLYLWAQSSGSPFSPAPVINPPPESSPQTPAEQSLSLSATQEPPAQTPSAPDNGAPQAPSPPVANQTAPTQAPNQTLGKIMPPAPRAGDSSAIQIRQSKGGAQLNPFLEKAYQAFQTGDYEAAQQLYQSVTRTEPNNRDAILGLAALALQKKQPEQAVSYYLRLLELSPQDPDALAGLTGLKGQSDPAQTESSLKKILLQYPGAAAVYFALGNVYAQQSRWPEAQQAYFRAHSNAPDNPDYAFNLAVGLDHLGQDKLALIYYQKALALSGPGGFDKAQARLRLLELQQSAGTP